MVIHWSPKKNRNIWRCIQIEQGIKTHNNALTLKKWKKPPSEAIKSNKEQKHSIMPSSWTRNRNTQQCIQAKQGIETPSDAFRLIKEQKHITMHLGQAKNKNTWWCTNYKGLTNNKNTRWCTKCQAANQTTKTHDSNPNKTIINTCQVLRT